MAFLGSLTVFKDRNWTIRCKMRWSSLYESLIYIYITPIAISMLKRFIVQPYHNIASKFNCFYLFISWRLYSAVVHLIIQLIYLKTITQSIKHYLSVCANDSFIIFYADVLSSQLNFFKVVKLHLGTKLYCGKWYYCDFKTILPL